MGNLSFRNFIKEDGDKQRAISDVLDGRNLILFFKKGEGIYGAPEDSRVVFARMKSPDEETPEGWGDDANFVALDLLKALVGQNSQSVFGQKDLEDINVLDKDIIRKLLMKKNVKHGLNPKHSNKDGGNIIRIKDKNQ